MILGWVFLGFYIMLNVIWRYVFSPSPGVLGLSFTPILLDRPRLTLRLFSYISWHISPPFSCLFLLFSTAYLYRSLIFYDLVFHLATSAWRVSISFLSPWIWDLSLRFSYSLYLYLSAYSFCFYLILRMLRFLSWSISKKDFAIISGGVCWASNYYLYFISYSELSAAALWIVLYCSIYFFIPSSTW